MRLPIGTIVIASALMLGAVGYASFSAPDRKTVEARRPTEASSLAVPGPTEPASVATVPTAAPGAPLASLGKWAQVERLIASGSPVSAFEAYGLLDFLQRSLQEYLEDPGIKAWRARSIRQFEAGAHAGDHNSALYLWQLYDTPVFGYGIDDPVKALTYMATWSEQRRLQAGEDAIAPALQRDLDRRAQALPAEQAQAAIAEGKRIASVNAKRQASRK